MAKGIGTWAARVTCVTGAAMVAWLGAWWAMDRARPWETPTLDGGFVVVRGANAPPADLWLVPVNLRCGHCREQLEAVWAARAGRRSPQLVALIVDHHRPPSLRAVADLRADQVWWDQAAAWRRRWGHRLYGEVLRFDGRGRYRGTQPPRPSASPPLASGTEGR